MRDGKALTNIDEFGGKSYKAGDKISGKVLAQVSPQVIKALVDNYKIEIQGMEPSSGGGAGGLAHLTARLDQQADTIKAQAKQIETLVAGCKVLNERIIVLEGGKIAAPKVKKPAKAAAAKTAARCAHA